MCLDPSVTIFYIKCFKVLLFNTPLIFRHRRSNNFGMDFLTNLDRLWRDWLWIKPGHGLSFIQGAQLWTSDSHNPDTTQDISQYKYQVKEFCLNWHYRISFSPDIKLFLYLVKNCLSISDFKTNPRFGKIFVFQHHFIFLSADLVKMAQNQERRRSDPQEMKRMSNGKNSNHQSSNILIKCLIQFYIVLVSDFMHSNNNLPFTWMWLSGSFLWIINDNIKEVSNWATLPCFHHGYIQYLKVLQKNYLISVWMVSTWVIANH